MDPVGLVDLFQTKPAWALVLVVLIGGIAAYRRLGHILKANDKLHDDLQRTQLDMAKYYVSKADLKDILDRVFSLLKQSQP